MTQLSPHTTTLRKLNLLRYNYIDVDPIYLFCFKTPKARKTISEFKTYYFKTRRMYLNHIRNKNHRYKFNGLKIQM